LLVKSPLQQHGLGRIWMVRAVVVLLVFVSGYLIFEFGRISAGYDLVEAGDERQAFVDHVQALDKEVADLKQEIAILKTNIEVDRASYKEVEASLTQLQAKIQEQRDAIGFYRGIVSPADGNAGLRVQNLKLTRGKAEREFNLRLVLVQAMKHDRKVSGDVSLSVIGSQDGAEITYALTQLLPDEADNERKDMRKRGVQSILGIPIMSKGRFVGFLGMESFDRETNWPEETIMLLRMIGEIFYSALHRRRAVEDLRQSQSQLLQSQKIEAVGTLAGGIAHDFNNHLAVMLANARFVRQEVEAEAEVVAAIEDFERSADHCAQLTRSLLAFSRRTPVEIVPVEVAGLVEGVEELVRPLLPSTIHFEMELMPDLGSFAVDRVQIQQVLVNLLVNARDAMPDGGLIRLDACRRPILSAEATAKELDEFREYVVLSVRDVGQGMDEETQSRVFEPFFTTKEVGHGTGLGLAMAYGIVRQSEGAIAVESRQGQGSTFRIYLPGLEVAFSASSK
jgi:signal transduction histidine kinase